MPVAITIAAALPKITLLPVYKRCCPDSAKEIASATAYLTTSRDSPVVID
jgi:hypothetical protein